MDISDSRSIEITISDPSQLGSLQQFLDLNPDVHVYRRPGKPRPGEQGALDLLAVFAGSGGLLTAIKVLPEFLRSRRTGLSIAMTIKGRPFTLTATNAEEIMPILQRLLDD